MRLLTPVFILAAVLAVGWYYYFGGYYVDAWKMEDVVGTAALSWQALGENRGHEDLVHELKHREIGEYLTPEDCTFYERPDHAKVVDCIWNVDVYLPLGLGGRRLDFEVLKTATTEGRLEK